MGRLVGGLVGWLGGHPPRELHLHSHILGVLPDSEARGLGFELKQHQRRWCLERGVSVDGVDVSTRSCAATRTST